ncbi:unnamed protein product [Prorocentrum cordatum]|uniref:Uncharacterized protein n=1 Tax=Prorocentrum cordatum TaxID=2364126 RepID=A0ABN9P870_9DINO|nr:unnamed protein product [Polarella glacialis]
MRRAPRARALGALGALGALAGPLAARRPAALAAAPRGRRPPTAAANRRGAAPSPSSPDAAVAEASDEDRAQEAHHCGLLRRSLAVRLRERGRQVPGCTGAGAAGDAAVRRRLLPEVRDRPGAHRRAGVCHQRVPWSLQGRRRPAHLGGAVGLLERLLDEVVLLAVVGYAATLFAAYGLLDAGTQAIKGAALDGLPEVRRLDAAP